MPNIPDKSIVPGSGDGINQLRWPSSGAIPTSYSSAGWTVGNEGVAQQTFLGASIRNFSLKGGFGGSSSSLSVSLVEDEYNQSDTLGRGLGDDVYHDGVADSFRAPMMGSPVFFKFGPTMATVAEAWQPTLDKLYLLPANRSPFPLPVNANDKVYYPSGEITHRPSEHHFFDGKDPVTQQNVWADESRLIVGKDRGYRHLVFGGILQSVTENKGQGGLPTYSVNVTDPREILSNVTVILSDYAGSVFGQQNMLNVFGFLEYDPSDALQKKFDLLDRNVLTKNITPLGAVNYTGNDTYINKNPLTTWDRTAPVFPITGEGMSRRSSKGIPFYRITQAIDALLEYNGKLPDEYANAFGTEINFRGYKYVVDFSGLPLHLLPPMYNIDFAQTDLLSLVQEVCSAISRDLYVSLLPVTNHQSMSWLYEWNNYWGPINPRKMIAGVIRIDCIDRSQEPQYGAVKKYLNRLEASGVDIVNKDLGFELTNNPVDKFVVGAQETKMHYFQTNSDRDFISVRKDKLGLGPTRANLPPLEESAWGLSTALSQSILPFYGFLGKDAVTIPRGWGSYQQILLDTSDLKAHGVGNYYVATELELRAAMVSFERWKQFLLQYSETYMESMEEGDFLEIALANAILIDPDNPPQYIDDDFMMTMESGVSKNYAVTVPRCVWRSDKDYVDEHGLPASPCSPPLGYPLYYKRAEKIGIPEAGIAKIAADAQQIVTDYATLKKKLSATENTVELAASEWDEVAADLLESHGLDPSESLSNFTSFANASYGAMYDLGVWLGNLSATEEERGSEANVVPAVDDNGEGTGAGGYDDETLNELNALTNVVASGNNTIARIKDQMGKIQDTIDANCKLLKSVNRLGEETLENAMRVYNFVKGVADKHLGKTYLVKIPKQTNTSYSTDIVQLPWGEIDRGPFGFKPEPVSSAGPNFFYTSTFQATMNKHRNNNIPYKYGALKNNFDPIEDQWKHNYTPDSNGGYSDFYMYPQTVLPHNAFGTSGVAVTAKSNSRAAASVIKGQAYQPPAIRNYLFPVDGTNFIDDNGRVGAYVRFDNSQFLSFDGVGKESMSQQQVSSNGFLIPDILGDLDNMKPDKFTSFKFPDSLKNKPKSVAFVKCSVDDKLYMPPKRRLYNDIPVFGRYVRDIGAVRKPKKVWNKKKCKFEFSLGYYLAHLVPYPETGGAAPGGSTEKDYGPTNSNGDKIDHIDFARRPNSILQGNMVETNIQDLDNDHVYAIITLDSRVTPLIDSRMQDGPFQSFNASTIKHYLTMDTVKVVEFAEPNMRGEPARFQRELCATAGAGNVLNAFNAYKQALKNMKISSPEAQIHYTAPSPVYPNMVAIPLRSTERCYGPWVSSMIDDLNVPFLSSAPRAIRYQNLGGKMEFEKDENLAPWNFGGYHLMNEAGILKAAFSNSPTLFSERGGFIYAGLPRGNDLGSFLCDGGPLVTDISVDVGTGGVKTTYKMDLYTPKFGKLKKQQEDLIGTISREHQRLRDTRNVMIRNGLIQGFGSNNFTSMFKTFDPIRNQVRDNSQFFSSLEQSSTYNDVIVGSVSFENVEDVNMSGDAIRYKRVKHEVSTMPNKIYQQALSIFPDSQSRDSAYYNSAGGGFGDMFVPISEEKHPNMAYMDTTFHAKKKEKFYSTDNKGE